MRGAINHIDLTVADIARSLAFYDVVLDFLGYARSQDYAGSVPVWTLRGASPRSSIGLHRATRPVAHDRSGPGLHHLAFHVPDRRDVDACHRLLRSIGARVLDAPADYDYTPGYYAVFFEDPDGIKLEVVHEPTA